MIEVIGRLVRSWVVSLFIMSEDPAKVLPENTGSVELQSLVSENEGNRNGQEKIHGSTEDAENFVPSASAGAADGKQRLLRNLTLFDGATSLSLK